MNQSSLFEYYEDVRVSSPQSLPPLSLNELLKAIHAWPGCTKKRRENFASALQTAHRILLADTVPVGLADGHDFTCANLNRALYAQPPALLGLNPRRFQAIVSMVRGLLRHLGRHAPETRGSDHLTPDWRVLYDALGTAYGKNAGYRQAALIAFMIYCGKQGIAPAAATDQTLADFGTFLTTRTITPDIPGRMRRVASNWNAAIRIAPGWPSTRLNRASMRDEYTLRLNAYPPSFEADARNFLGHLAGGPEDDGLNGAMFLETDAEAPKPRARALKPRTIETRLWHIRQAAGTLVQIGVPAAEIQSLSDLVQPLERVRHILRYLKERTQKRWQTQGKDIVLRDVRSSNITGIADTLRQIAKFHARLPDKDVEKIANLVTATKPLATGSMSQQNAERLTVLAQPRAMAMLLHLPEFLVFPERFLETGTGATRKPRDAALNAMYGALLEIGLICPLRRGNIANLTLDRHLQWDAGRKRLLALVIPANEVKNRTPIHWPVPPESAALIQTYIQRFRPLLTTDSTNRFLFPNTTNGPRAGHDLAVETVERVRRLVGADFNLHLLRHIAVLRYLTHHPGEYATVRLLLGHASLATTVQFYAGLEAEAAARHYDTLVNNDRKASRTMALAALRGAGPGRPGRGGR